jgi:hypothetical protein
MGVLAATVTRDTRAQAVENFMMIEGWGERVVEGGAWSCWVTWRKEKKRDQRTPFYNLDSMISGLE